MKTKIVIISVIILGIVLVGLLSRRNSGSVGNNTKSEITIGMVTFPGYAPLHIAKAKGYYGNTDVKLVFIESPGELRSAMMAGTIDAYEMTYDMFLLVRDLAPNAVAILATDVSRGADGVVAVANIAKPEDLRGLRIASEPGFPAYLLLMSYLKQGGMTLADIDFQDMSTSDITAAFTSGAVVVAGTYEPYMSQMVAQKSGAHVLVSTTDTENLALDYLWVSPKTLTEKKEALRDVARGYFRAVDLIKTSPDEAFALAGPAFGMTGPEMAEFQSGIFWPDQKYNEQLFNVSNPKGFVKTFEYVRELLRDNGQTNLNLPADKYFSTEILDSIK